MAAAAAPDLARVLDDAGCPQDVGDWVIAKCDGRLATFVAWIKKEEDIHGKCIEPLEGDGTILKGKTHKLADDTDPEMAPLTVMVAWENATALRKKTLATSSSGDGGGQPSFNQ